MQNIEKDTQFTEGNLSVWWIPQIPGKAFRVLVSSIKEGRDLCDVLAAYDQFQFDQHVKGDYSNVGGIARWEKDTEPTGTGFDWFDVDDEEVDVEEGEA